MAPAYETKNMGTRGARAVWASDDLCMLTTCSPGFFMHAGGAVGEGVPDRALWAALLALFREFKGAVHASKPAYLVGGGRRGLVRSSCCTMVEASPCGPACLPGGLHSRGPCYHSR